MSPDREILRREIAAYRRDNKALRLREAYIASILNTVHDGIITFDDHGLVTTFNDSAVKIFRYKTTEIIGRSIKLLFPEENPNPGDPSAVHLTMETLGSFLGLHRDMDAKGKSGTLIPIEININEIAQSSLDCMSQAGGEEKARKLFVASIRDISLRKKAEEAAAQAMTQAIEANQAKTQFMANISHEIRTPLNGMLGLVQLLLAEDMSKDQMSRLKQVLNSGESLMSIINDIIDHSRLELGKLSIQKHDCDLVEIVENVLELFAPQAHVRDLELVAFVDPQVPCRIRTDPLRIRQVLTNLISNALKFTSKGGISVHISCDDLSEDAPRILFEIKDTGIGVRAEEVSKLFKAFSQIGDLRINPQTGSGLGLSICKEIVGLLGGNISVESQLGAGSVFSFDILLEAASPPRVWQTLANLRALIVESNDVARDTYAKQLKAWGIEARTLASGYELVVDWCREAALHGAPFDVVLIDESLLGEGVKTFCSFVHADINAAKTKIVLMIDSNEKIDIEKIKAIGFSSFLRKPIRQSNMIFYVSSSEDGLAQEPVQSGAVLENGAPLEARPQSIPAIKKMNILVVEDCGVNQMVVEGMIGLLGHDYHVASDGEAALDILNSGVGFDLILMDVQLPGISGLEATAIIRDLETPIKDTPIVALTANTMKGDREACLAAGMNDVLQKPYMREDLEKIILRWSGA